MGEPIGTSYPTAATIDAGGTSSGPETIDAAVRAGLEAVIKYLTSRQVYVIDPLAELFREQYEAAMAGEKALA